MSERTFLDYIETVNITDQWQNISFKILYNNQVRLFLWVCAVPHMYVNVANRTWESSFDELLFQVEALQRLHPIPIHSDRSKTNIR